MVTAASERDSSVIATAREEDASSADTLVDAFGSLPLQPQHINVLVQCGINPEVASAGLEFVRQLPLAPGPFVLFESTLGEFISYQLHSINNAVHTVSRASS
jgi:hypothetical protein